ncbi:hypothetical protein [Zobellella denitrificans]|uniref:hypothetical protein n=1 Tax=Zobellella denitrificans TaxID=347534 RepID=UPI00115EA20C|nr:hypothetical protein [Zobellella denitrificans]
MRNYIDGGCTSSTDARTVSGIAAGSYLNSRAMGYTQATTSQRGNAKRFGERARALVFPFIIGGSIGSAVSTDVATHSNSEPGKASFIPHVWVKKEEEQGGSDEIKKDSVSYAKLSQQLQKDFGFKKVAPWARVMKVERKTIYDWRKRPETEVQPRIAVRLEVLKTLHEGMEPEHRRFVSDMTFGRWSDADFSKALLAVELDPKALAEHYDRLFLDFVGLDKRDNLTGV